MTSIFHNADTAQLVDEYGDLKEKLKAMEDRIDCLKEEMVRRNITSASGSTYEIEVKHKTPKIPDQKALREYLGGLWENFLKESPRDEVRYKRKAPDIPFVHIAA